MLGKAGSKNRNCNFFWSFKIFLQMRLPANYTLNALLTNFTLKPFAMILFLFFFKFLIKPGVMIESLLGREIFLSWTPGTWSVLILFVFVGFDAVKSSISILSKSIALLSFPRARMTSNILPRRCPPLPRVSKIFKDNKILSQNLSFIVCTFFPPKHGLIFLQYPIIKEA